MKFLSKMMARGTKVYWVSEYVFNIQRNEYSDEGISKRARVGCMK